MRLFICSLFISFGLQAAVQPLAESRPIHEAFVQKNRADVMPLPVSGLKPPAAFPEKIPPQRHQDTIWIPGYWSWVEESQTYEWVCGVWRRPPEGHVWISGSWIPANGGYAYLQGFWSEVPFNNLKYISKAPPEALEESVPDSPGEQYFYTRGYWDYSNGQYQWLQGAWVPFDPQWVLTFAHYVWRPEGYLFIPAYWDYPLEERGDAYFCDGNSEQITVIQPQVIIEQLYTYYPDYIPIYWHWWHFHPGFWDGCDCMPPWWGWHGWWGLGWHDQWAIWWWWGHPGFPAPMWLSADLALKIGPPGGYAIDFFKKANGPFFITPNGIPKGKKWWDKTGPYLPKNPKELEGIKGSLGDTLPKGDSVRPQGKGKEKLPPPKFPSDLSGKGKVTPPSKPKAPPRLPPKVTIPKAPEKVAPSAPDYHPQPQQDWRPKQPIEPKHPPQYEDRPRYPKQPDQGNIPQGPHYPKQPDHRGDYVPKPGKPGYVTPPQDKPSDKGWVTPPQPEQKPQTPNYPQQDKPKYDRPNFVNPAQSQPDFTPNQPQRQQFEDKLRDRMKGRDKEGK